MVWSAKVGDDRVDVAGPPVDAALAGGAVAEAA
jgi:hypothetical protein